MNTLKYEIFIKSGAFPHLNEKLSSRVQKKYIVTTNKNTKLKMLRQ